MTALSITQAIRKAPSLVKKPKKIIMPPISSANAAAPIQSQAGRMKGKGDGKAVKPASPGPLKLPKTFCAPWAKKIVPIAKRNGTGTHVADVEISLLNIWTILSDSETWKSAQDINHRKTGRKGVKG